MTEKERIKVAAFRYGIISAVIHDSKKNQKKHFKEQAQKTYDVPLLGLRKYKWRTFKSWLKIYRSSDIDGLKPVERKDKGRPRRIDPELAQNIRAITEERPGLSSANLYRLLIQEKRSLCPPSEGTVRKFLKDNGLNTLKKEPTPRKKYEAPFVNDLWVADFMHGPAGLFGKKGGKVYLCAIIDDHSRMIVGAGFHFRENTLTLERTFKKAILTYGRPKRFYCDNGAAFSSSALLWTCGKLEVALIHSKPYDSPSRGKIERWFRTVREKFLNPGWANEAKSLDHLNQLFEEWLNRQYHKSHHSGIHDRPFDRYMDGLKKISPRMITPRELDLCFYQVVTRKVKKDSTLSLNNQLYETPPRFIGSTVEIRFPTDAPDELTLYENGEAVQLLKPVDVHKNSELPQGIRFSRKGRKEEEKK